LATPECTPKGWRRIDGKGWLALVDCDQEPDRDVPGLVGPVRIADRLYECIAVERTLIDRPTIHVGETIGLLLKDAG
jgi:hypothetical protein